MVIPATIVTNLVLDDSSTDAWSYLFGLITLFGFATAGYAAGRARNDTPMMHGAAAAFVCYAVVQVIGAISLLARGESINPLRYPFSALLAATMGVAGGLFADWYHRRAIRA